MLGNEPPLVSLLINGGTNHLNSLRFSKGQDVPELTFRQANARVKRTVFPSTIDAMLGESSRIAGEDHIEPVMYGLRVIGGPIESYRVSSPLGVNFGQLHSSTGTTYHRCRHQYLVAIPRHVSTNYSRY